MTRTIRIAALIAGPSAGFLGLVGLFAAVSVVGGVARSAATCATPNSMGAGEIPPTLLPIYQQAAGSYGLGPDGWAWLAAVNRIETDFGRDLATSTAGAVGWMQFEPATWAEFGVDGDGDGRRDPNVPADAIPAAAGYLHSLGAPADWQTAIRAYNGGPGQAGSPSTLAYWNAAARAAASYVGSGDAPCAAAPPAPLAPGDRARILSDGRAAAPAGAPAAVRAMIAAGNQLIGKPYVYGGGHADWQPAAGYDCSSSVSWALHAAGYLSLPDDSITLEGFGAAGAGAWVTVFANPAHAFAYIAGIRLDTSPQSGDGAFGQLGPRWRPANRSTSGFIPRHPVGL